MLRWLCSILEGSRAWKTAFIKTTHYPLVTRYGNTDIDQQRLSKDKGLFSDGIKPIPQPIMTRNRWHPSQYNFKEQDIIATINIQYTKLPCTSHRGHWVKRTCMLLLIDFSIIWVQCCWKADNLKITRGHSFLSITWFSNTMQCYSRYHVGVYFYMQMQTYRWLNAKLFISNRVTAALRQAIDALHALVIMIWVWWVKFIVISFIIFMASSWYPHRAVSCFMSALLCGRWPSSHYCLPGWICWSAALQTRFMRPTWGPSGADRTQVGPMLAPWTLLSGVPCDCSWATVLTLGAIDHGPFSVYACASS